MFNNLTGRKHRLPTDIEWEYAARGGTIADYPFELTLIDLYVWYDKNSNDQTHPVAQKLPNYYGLYDMLGNVFERITFDDASYPYYDKKYSYRHWRGMSYFNPIKSMRPSVVYAIGPSDTDLNEQRGDKQQGFRLVREL